MRRRIETPGGGIGLAVVVALGVAVLVVVGLLSFGLPEGDDGEPLAPAAERTTSGPTPRPTAPSPTARSTSSVRSPGGKAQVRAVAQRVIDGLNQRDGDSLRATSCTGSSPSEGLLERMPPDVRFTLDGDPGIAGFRAEVGYRVSGTDSGRSRTGKMHLNWDGARWCFDDAT